MTVYSVYEPTSDDEDLATRAGRVAFVKDGFAWFALIVPALWLLYHRMWIELIVFLAVLAGLQFALGFDRLEQEPVSWAALALGPNAFMPADSNLSTRPAASGSSGPTTTSPTLFSRANSRSCLLSSESIGIFWPHWAVPGLPGAI